MLQRIRGAIFLSLRVLSVMLLVAATAVTSFAAAPGDGRVRVKYPKNIIIMFADGAASTQWELGKYAARHLRNESYAVTDVVFREGTLGLLSTHPLDAYVTDSAAAGSAMSTGQKVNNFALSMNPQGRPYRTVMEAAKARGRRIGLVTTATVYDASPAAFSVHAQSRGDYQSIVDQYLVLEPDVLLGGGGDYFMPAGTAGGSRNDGKDVIAAFAGKGYQIVRDTMELNAANGPRLLGLFAQRDMDLEIDNVPAKQPSTAQMTAAALKALSGSSPNGFVLFVENENTDTAGHTMDAAALIKALWAFDEAVRAALDFQRKTPRETLVIVCGDHETGGLSPTYALGDPVKGSRQKTFSISVEHLKLIAGITQSIKAAADGLGSKPSAKALDAMLARHFPGFKLDGDLRKAILNQQPLERNYTYVTASALSRMVARQTGLYWGTSGHTTQPVVVGAIGPGARLFHGYQDNTDFGKHLHRLIGGARGAKR